MSTQEGQVRKIEGSKFKAQVVEIENLGRELNMVDITRPSGLKKPEYVLSFHVKVFDENGEFSGREWQDLVVEPLSPGQMAILSNTPFAKSAQAAKEKLDKILDQEVNEENAQEFVNDEENQPMLDEFENYKLEVAIMALKRLPNTPEEIREWLLAQDDEVIDDVYEAAMNGVTSVDDVDVFPEEDDGAGDEGRADPAGSSM